MDFSTPFAAFVQCIGILGMAANIFSLLLKRYRDFCLAQFVGAILFVTHFALLGSFGGCLLNAVCMLRMALMLFGGEKLHKPWALAVLIVLFVGSSVFLVAGGYDIPFAFVPCAVTVAGTLAIWSRNDRAIRLVQLCLVSPGWMSYDIISGSLGGVLCESFCICSTVVFLIRSRRTTKA